MAHAGYPLAFYGIDAPRGMALVAEAIKRSPSFAWAWTSRGMLEALHGADLALAAEHAARAPRPSPRDPLAFRNYITQSRYRRERRAA